MVQLRHGVRCASNGAAASDGRLLPAREACPPNLIIKRNRREPRESRFAEVRFIRCQYGASLIRRSIVFNWQPPLSCNYRNSQINVSRALPRNAWSILNPFARPKFTFTLDARRATLGLVFYIDLYVITDFWELPSDIPVEWPVRKFRIFFRLFHFLSILTFSD